MKQRKIGILLLLAAVLMFIYSSWKFNSQNTLNSDDFIRFHVIANSDSKEDQALKLKVRDGVITNLNKTLLKAKSIEESRTFIKSDLKEIENIAKGVVKANGYDYPVKANLGVRWIPEKTYGNLTFPAGEYEALNIVIGSGKGHNWWCVLFPPLCLIDSSQKGRAGIEEFSKNELLAKHYKVLLENRNVKRTLQLKFKSVETAEKLNAFIKQIKSKERIRMK